MCPLSYQLQFVIAFPCNRVVLASDSTLHVEHDQHPKVLFNSHRVHKSDKERTAPVLWDVMTRIDKHLQNVGNESVHLLATASAAVLKIAQVSR